MRLLLGALGGLGQRTTAPPRPPPRTRRRRFLFSFRRSSQALQFLLTLDKTRSTAWGGSRLLRPAPPFRS